MRKYFNKKITKTRCDVDEAINKHKAKYQEDSNV
jgi:hypothetical protein